MKFGRKSTPTTVDVPGVDGVDPVEVEESQPQAGPFDSDEVGDDGVQRGRPRGRC